MKTADAVALYAMTAGIIQTHTNLLLAAHTRTSAISPRTPREFCIV
jgi:hypothetical protein